MSNSTQKREVLVALDAEFADKIDQLTDDWTRRSNKLSVSGTLSK